MTMTRDDADVYEASTTDLARYYLARGLVAAGWVALAFAIGPSHAVASAVLLVAYPAWDALANWFDARGSGGLRTNPSQALNVVVSLTAAIAVAGALQSGMHAVSAVFGVWAALAGLAQLVTGIRRWRAYGAQWPMILSGAQSVLAGCHFVVRASGAAVPTITDVAPYAAFGAFYFLVSAVWLMIAARRA
jgi:uncharacterized membrane protein HdeD (DUF308 family)